MTILVSLPSSPPSPVSFSPPAGPARSARGSCSWAADSSAPARSRSSVTSVIWRLLRLGGYTSLFWVLFPCSGDNDGPAGGPGGQGSTGPECSCFGRRDGLGLLPGEWVR